MMIVMFGVCAFVLAMCLCLCLLYYGVGVGVEMTSLEGA